MEATDIHVETVGTSLFGTWSCLETRVEEEMWVLICVRISFEIT